MVIKVAVVFLIVRTGVKILLIFLLLFIADQLDAHNQCCHKDQANNNQQEAAGCGRCIAFRQRNGLLRSKYIQNIVNQHHNGNTRCIRKGRGARKG